ncbi:hypothetical protein GWI33_016396 [Rhynchophorus ferrugineus]|uniref:Uncharacterized protein n=1 Tax=Rhynchophorus ferrugineus TaxID=354439 RepID=A0A834M8R5_RHYFE|nr:hypothetical protein GWI33_016396 [Rhynchophorus ferrugineus]
MSRFSVSGWQKRRIFVQFTVFRRLPDEEPEGDGEVTTKKSSSSSWSSYSGPGPPLLVSRAAAPAKSCAVHISETERGKASRRAGDWKKTPVSFRKIYRNPVQNDDGYRRDNGGSTRYDLYINSFGTFSIGPVMAVLHVTVRRPHSQLILRPVLQHAAIGQFQ